MFLCSTAAYSFAIPFASNGRCRLISLCQRYQDALSVTVLSHLYPEQGNLARVLTRRKKKKKKKSIKKQTFSFQNIVRQRRKKKVSGSVWSFLLSSFPSPPYDQGHGYLLFRFIITKLCLKRNTYGLITSLLSLSKTQLMIFRTESS